MDARVPDTGIWIDDEDSENFLLREGLEVLALYRSIRNEAVRHAVKEMIALISNATDDLK